ncbi:Uu.00g104310.m01.CDS01 [Anthostomella pinea]|uniref:Uu.00g104310.m01.CDS01 n=1 Tax=Anthostomella pinea TaxID=933095 RepID=A0AAI8VER1_9PEZI|nr:Uu.00g104310.m01.CDS01 [Anthostomella pinea]
MASRGGADAKPEVGEILVVIHDFLARSSDELSLAKGDRVELIERDDEFGDGWFLGRHMVNGNSGLFPEVYTRSAPRGVPASSVVPKTLASIPVSTNGAGPEPSEETNTTTTSPGPTQDRASTPLTTTSNPAEPDPVTLPLNSVKPETSPGPTPTAPLASKGFNYGGGLEGMGRLNAAQSQSQDSPVLHETLTVIDEHITDLHSKPQNGAMHNATDSGSEYSSQMQDRLSYIQGEETDEEEDAPHTREEVEAWTADDVAEFLFTAGVEKKHCEVFRDQEIAGEVLLGMDQSSLFLKAFDLGSVGRRLKTWQKIKSLQDEVNGLGLMTRRLTIGSDAGSEDSRVMGRMRSRTNTLTNSQRLPPIEDRPGSVHGRRLSQTPKVEPMSPKMLVSPKTLHDSPTKPSHFKRPSAASVRDLHHSRRHSSTDYRLTGTPPVSAGTPKLSTSGTFPRTETSHKKQPSFDRNWTMGGAATPTATPPRPLSSAGLQNTLNTSDPDIVQEPAVDFDRGYFSSTEVDGRKRNVLKKRDSVAANSHHSRKSSYTEQQRVRSATALSRRSRFGSVDSTRDSVPPSAAQLYYGTAGDHRRTASTNTTESYRPPPPAKDGPSPTVTKLEDSIGSSPIMPANRQGVQSDWLSNPGGKMTAFGGLRAISDAVIGTDRSKFGSPADSTKDSPLQSPARTGSSTPSAGPSFELDSPEAGKSPYSNTTVGSRKSSNKKTKKETSAYLRGLQKVGPREAIKDADYSGWMKKKSSHLMTTWKPRLFVLKGRRLSYYYSEDDTEEKGLIDISFHRVLPADSERLTGLHATLTGASNSPMAPADSSIPTLADSQAATAVVEKGTDTMFIFKLQPPRAGLSKAVNFTKPTVHYFAVPNLQQGRTWMAALMKATIDRDDNQPMTSTYQQKTISLAKARAMRHRPPALMNLDEKVEEGTKDDDEKKNGLGISFGEVDSAVSGLEKMGLQVESATVNKTFDTENSNGLKFVASPQSA